MSSDLPFEIEPFDAFDVPRRDFLKTVGGGLAVVCLLREAPAQVRTRRRRTRGGRLPNDIGAWLHIGKDGQITVYTGKVELGQGIRTSLGQVAAEELRVSTDAVRLVMADTELTPYDRGTWGSRTTPDMVPRIRRAAAAAREVLIDLANEQWKVDRKSIDVAGGRVVHPSKTQALKFGDLTKGRKLVKAIPAEVPETAPSEWKVCGKPAPRANGTAIVTGTHRYAADLVRPGMLHGKVLRPPTFGETVGSVDLSRAKAIKGVTAVHDGDFVGFAALDAATAARAVGTIKVEWKTDLNAQPSHRDVYDYLRKHSEKAGAGSGLRRRGSGNKTGSVADGLAAADRRFKQTYTTAYIAHAPLEPRAAVAEWADGALTVWIATQAPFGIRAQLARTFRMPESRVRVIAPDTGGGYGGKSRNAMVAIETARLAKAAGKPVKTAWTREEEFTWAYFRPAAVIDVESGAKSDGTITAWRFCNINAGSAAIRHVYSFPNQEMESRGSNSPLRQGSYRALAATANNFARETHIDEIARGLKMDPIDLRMKNLQDERLRAVIQAAAKRFDRGRKRTSSDRGVGFACGFEKGSYTATCAEILVDRRRGDVRVERIVTAFECGAIVNPDNVENQVVGCTIMGLGGAVFEAIEFDKGKILNPRFSSYRVPRFSDVPVIETVLLDRKDLTSVGAGETPILGVAPAIGSAIFDATGNRLRSLPLLSRGQNIRL